MPGTYSQLLLHAVFTRPSPIDGKADLRDGRTFGRVAQFRIAGQVAGENDFVKAGHGTFGGCEFYFAGLGSGELVKMTRNTSSFSANLLRKAAIAAGALVKITFA